jgi:acetyl esterase/lipase
MPRSLSIRRSATVFAGMAWMAVACDVAGDPCRLAAQPPATTAVTVVHNIPYRDSHSKQWRLDLAWKKDLKGKPHPAIVVVHGGGWLEGDRSSFASRKHGVSGNIEDSRTRLRRSNDQLSPLG